jgi:antitoxin (DNA-binding transcriptional repressor) of toxin-antitoxin stability system
MSILTVNTHEAKSRLSELLRMVEEGDQVFLARNGVTIAQIVRAVQTRPVRKPGVAKGKITVAPEYDLVGSDPEIAATFDDRDLFS